MDMSTGHIKVLVIQKVPIAALKSEDNRFKELLHKPNYLPYNYSLRPVECYSVGISTSSCMILSSRYVLYGYNQG